MSYAILILSVLIGSAIVFFIKPNTKFIRLLLAFSGAYLLSVTILHLLPEVYEHSKNTKLIGILILSGILVQSVLESFSKGAEHGHIHIHSKHKEFPWLLFVSLCIHAFSEGLPIHSAGHNLLWAIAVHKIPIAIVLTSFFLQTNYPKIKIFSFLFLFSLMSALGYFIGNSVPFFMNNYAEINAFVIGILLHISTIILFEGSENHKFNIRKFTAILLGILLTIITL